VTVAAVVRALVDTAAAEWREGREAPAVPATLIRLASWKAALCGVEAELLDPLRMTPVSARRALRELFRHIADSAEDAGDGALVRAGLTAILERGTGAAVQRREFARRGDPRDVVRAAVGTQRAAGIAARPPGGLAGAGASQPVPELAAG
jgi:carboxylate-amine ligase